MSRHPSPGPSQAHTHTQTFQQVPTQSTRQKARSFPVGISAGAEDVKYQAKYKELKRKVKEIEADNDKLHFKVLQAKRSIQRMKLERAVLYERLAALPHSPIDDRHANLPLIHSGPGVPTQHPSSHGVPSNYPREARDCTSSMDPDHTLMEYIRTTGNPRVVPGPDGRPVPVIDPSMGPGVAPSRALPPAHASRRGSAGSVPEPRQLPPLTHLPIAQHLDAPRGQSHSSHSTHSHSSPHMHHPTSHSNSSHERSGRSHSSSHSRDIPTPGRTYNPGQSHSQQYPENLPPVQQVLHSPPLSEAERARRHDIHDIPGSHSDPHSHIRHQASLPPLSPQSHSADSRSSRIHNHQRLGPGTYINRGDEQLERDPERDRDWERNREQAGKGRELSSAHMHSPPSVHRSRHRMNRGDYPELPMSSRVRDDQGYYQDVSGPGGYPIVSRSGTPVSVSGDGPSRPESRTQIYDQDRPRSYRLRPVNQPDEELGLVHDEGRTLSQPRDRGTGGGGALLPPEQNRVTLDSRKRSRNDMEVDGENDLSEYSAGSGGGSTTFTGGRLPDDRGSKRYHRDSHIARGPDRQEGDS